MINLDTVLELGKTFSAKSEKDDDKHEIVRAHVKFTALAVDRDTCDELIGTVPLGWTSSVLFDGMGAPIARLTLSLDDRQLKVTGSIRGANDEGSLPLMQAALTDIEITLVKLGAWVSGSLAWQAKGDEVEDVTDLLGKTCKAIWRITSEEQQDMLRSAVANIARRGGATITSSSGDSVTIPDRSGAEVPA